MKKITFILLISLCIISCKKEDTHTETKPVGNYNVVITYKKDMPIRSISYDKRTNKKMFDYRYDANGNMVYSNAYYDNGKMESTLKLFSLPNCYFSQEYFPTGILAAEGNVVLFHKKKAVRTGPWIVYKQDGSVYAFAEYIVDKKKEKQLLIKKKIIPYRLYLVKKNGKLIEDKRK